VNTRTLASIAIKTAPREPMHYSSDAVKDAYIDHFEKSGGVRTEVDTAGLWQHAQMRRAWRFPDGSIVISDWA